VSCLNPHQLISDEQNTPVQPQGRNDTTEEDMYEEDTWGDGTMQSNAQRDDDDWVSPEWDGPARPGSWNRDWVSKSPQMGDKW